MKSYFTNIRTENFQSFEINQFAYRFDMDSHVYLTDLQELEVTMINKQKFAKIISSISYYPSYFTEVVGLFSSTILRHIKKMLPSKQFQCISKNQKHILGWEI